MGVRGGRAGVPCSLCIPRKALSRRRYPGMGLVKPASICSDRTDARYERMDAYLRDCGPASWATQKRSTSSSAGNGSGMRSSEQNDR